MNTRIFTTSDEDIAAAAAIIRGGGLVAFPTETVYGLGADALNRDAVEKIYQAKGRPSDNPLIVHVAEAGDLQLVADFSGSVAKVAKLLAKCFWPGPLTLVLKRKAEVPDVTTGGLDTVAVRVPGDMTARALIGKAGCPVAAPSANLSGRPSPTMASHVIEDLDGRVDAVIAGEKCRIGIESTVLDVTGEIPVILRPGVITKHDIETALGKKAEIDPSLLKKELLADERDNFGPKAPGMKYAHYAPKAHMTVVEGRRVKVRSAIRRFKEFNERNGAKVGVILFEEKAFMEAAHDFFAELREFDRQGVDIILAGAISDENGVGFAVMDRMLKSAGYNVVKV